MKKKFKVLTIRIPVDIYDFIADCADLFDSSPHVIASEALCSHVKRCLLNSDQDSSDPIDFSCDHLHESS